MTTDWATFVNWLVTGLLAFLFGTLSSFIIYRYEKKRDDISWQREKEKMEAEWKHDIELLEKQLNMQLEKTKFEERKELVNDLLRGLENPTKAINTLTRTKLRSENSENSNEMPSESTIFSAIYKVALASVQDELLSTLSKWENNATKKTD